MQDLKHTAQTWLAAGQRVELVEVLASRGSVPREPGTRMLVSAHATAGTIGGGHLEWKAIATAHERLATQAELDTQEQHYPLGPALGQCCGGAVSLRFRTLQADELNRWPSAPPRFHLQLFGAGHVGRAIVRALMPLPVRVDWIDEREREFPAPDAALPAAGGAQVRRHCVDAVEAEVRLAPPGACYLVLTHQHALDMRIAEAILRRGDFAFFGLIGSRTKRQRFVHRFEQLGLPTAQLARMTCPIGVAGVAGKEPEVIAAAVVAQLLQFTPVQPRSGAPDRGAARTADALQPEGTRL